jgi:hypothetical protein
MPPRSNNGKKRRPQNNHRESSSRYRGTAGTSQRHHDSTFFNDDDDSERKIRLLGISLPNPLHHIRSNLPSPSALLSNVTFPAKIVFVGGVAVLLLAPLFDSYLGGSLASFLPPLLLRGGGGGSSAGGENNDENGIVGAALPHVTKDGKFHGRYPNSLLTLFYPFTLFRDVVLDQPVDPSDVPFFWHAHVSDEVAVKAVLSKCYDADIVELNSVEDVERAKGLNLVSTLVAQGRLGPAAVERDGLYNGQRRRPLVIASPHIREAAELFSQDNFGRTFSFYRHPIDYDVHPNLRRTLPPEAGANNFMTRLLSDVHVGPLSFKELGTAKQVIRQTTIAGTRDLMAESMLRFGKYYGWVPVGGSGTRDGVESDDVIAKACIEDAVRDVPGERYADHDSPEWRAFYEANKLDCELYEIARSTWRAQIQTIIPLTLQKRRAGEGDEDEKEGEDEERAV